MRRIDLTGQRFGRLLVTELDRRERRTRWVCRCDCGNTAVVRASNLRNAHTQSCGCLWQEKITKHGHAARSARSRTYNSWASMVRRCTNPDHPRYADWGGRGIRVCDRWLDFANFLADMGERPSGKTLDRKDNDGNYEPGNCRWATAAEQTANSRVPKITPAMAQEIRAPSVAGIGQRELGRRFGVTHSTIARALAYEGMFTRRS